VSLSGVLSNIHPSLQVNTSVYKCPDQVSQLLDTVKEEIDMIVLPDT